jgi:hypothetical protein
MTFGDPLKLIPCIAAIGVFTALCLGRITATEAAMLISGTVAVGNGISAVNNRNPGP